MWWRSCDSGCYIIIIVTLLYDDHSTYTKYYTAGKSLIKNASNPKQYGILIHVEDYDDPFRNNLLKSEFIVSYSLGYVQLVSI